MASQGPGFESCCCRLITVWVTHGSPKGFFSCNNTLSTYYVLLTAVEGPGAHGASPSRWLCLHPLSSGNTSVCLLMSSRVGREGRHRVRTPGEGGNWGPRSVLGPGRAGLEPARPAPSLHPLVVPGPRHQASAVLCSSRTFLLAAFPQWSTHCRCCTAPPRPW